VSPIYRKYQHAKVPATTKEAPIAIKILAMGCKSTLKARVSVGSIGISPDLAITARLTTAKELEESEREGLA
jgi:hypothetical protein